MAVPSHTSGFTVIPISYKASTTHYLYARSHSSTKSTSSSEALPAGRTLFLVNVPPDATERELVLFFKNSGTVEKVVFDFDVSEPSGASSDSEDEDEAEDAMDVAGSAINAKDVKKRRKGQKESAPIPTVINLPSKPLRKPRKTGLSAHVIFLDPSSLDRALASTSKPRAWPTSQEEPRGINHYQSLYASLRPPLDAVQAFADSSMEVYEYELAKTKHKSKYHKGEAIVDEDGFTLVVRGGAYGQTIGGGVTVATKQFQRSRESKRNRGQKKEKKEKEGFYGFQKAERQRSELIELKRKWEEDKAKVEKLKAARRFRPY